MDRLVDFENCKNNIGNIPLKEYSYYLGEIRKFNREEIISHTTNIYNFDIREYVEKLNYYWTDNKNYYSDFINKFPISIKDNGTREYFDKYSRPNYINFVNTYLGGGFDRDCLQPFLKSSDVHHIYPLVYGGDSQLKNLIHLSTFNHNLLHENPCEKNKIACHMGLDYLGSMYTNEGVYKILKENDIFNDCKPEMMMDYLKVIIKHKMYDFYEKIKIYFDKEVLVCH